MKIKFSNAWKDFKDDKSFCPIAISLYFDELEFNITLLNFTMTLYIGEV